jgi:hypothetical protein
MPMFKLRQVKRQMLFADMMECPAAAALLQIEKRFTSVPASFGV